MDLSNRRRLTLKFCVDAKRAGMPRDQVENFLRAGYYPQAKQMIFHAACRAADSPEGPKEIGMGGARGGCKSHSMFAQLTLDDCQRYPGLKVLMLRLVGKTQKEASRDLMEKVLHMRPSRYTYNRSSGEITFPNGSRIILGHFRTEADIDKYLGLELSLIHI